MKVNVRNSASEPALIGRSEAMAALRKMIERLGRQRCNVLLLGETGTGKDVVARMIHNQQAVGPFVPIDCSAVVDTLAESELFGYVKGSFTGASQSKYGLIEAANGGTAFLDEIGELPLDLQAKLLRLLQHKEFRRVGDTTYRKVDFRVIAATHRDLRKEVEQGTFRKDLYFRLNVITLRIPPLRERKEDILPLFDFFLARYGRQPVRREEVSHLPLFEQFLERTPPAPVLSQDVIQALLAYDWPGNVRELENCVQHMLAVNSGPVFHLADLPSSIQNHLRAQTTRQAALAAAAQAPGGTCTVTPVPLPILPLAELERQAIVRALEYTKGDRVAAATLLDIGRTTLYRKLKEYGLGASPHDKSADQGPDGGR